MLVQLGIFVLLLQAVLGCPDWDRTNCPFDETKQPGKRVLHYEVRSENPNNAFSLDLIPVNAQPPGFCLNCEGETSINLYLDDFVQGFSPCSWPENLNNRDVGEIFQVLDDPTSESAIDVGIAALFATLFLSGEDCIADLEEKFDEFACLLRREYDTTGFKQLHVKIVEEPETHSIQECDCLDCAEEGSLEINLIIPSFHGSACVEPRPAPCYPFDSKFLDWLLYRYELGWAKKNLAEYRALIADTYESARQCWLAGGSELIDLSDGLEAFRKFENGECLLSFERAYWKPAGPPTNTSSEIECNEQCAGLEEECSDYVPTFVERESAICELPNGQTTCVETDICATLEGNEPCAEPCFELGVTHTIPVSA